MQPALPQRTHHTLTTPFVQKACVFSLCVVFSLSCAIFFSENHDRRIARRAMLECKHTPESPKLCSYLILPGSLVDRQRFYWCLLSDFMRATLCPIFAHFWLRIAKSTGNHCKPPLHPCFLLQNPANASGQCWRQGSALYLQRYACVSRSE